MSPQQFIDLVCKMRTAQKQYFRTQLHDDLQQSKEYERQVDQALRDFSNPKDQLLLFSKAASQ
jgi:hypothetical protein